MSSQDPLLRVSLGVVFEHMLLSWLSTTAGHAVCSLSEPHYSLIIDETLHSSVERNNVRFHMVSFIETVL